MWPEGPYNLPRPSFAWPVSPPQVEPDSGPCICVQFNRAYQPYILGALQQLTQDATWRLGEGDDIQTVQGRIDRLVEMFGVTEGCSEPPPHPPITPTDDIDCKIASYLVRTVAKEAVLGAIAYATGGGEISILGRLLAFIPGVDGFIGKLGLAQKNLAGLIAANIGLPWVDTAAENTLWDLIGCTVYDGVKGVHQITTDTLGPLQVAIEALTTAFPEFLQGVAKLFGDLGADALNGIAELANVTDYDCSGCTDATPIIVGTDPSTLVPKPLIVTDGTTAVNDTSSITFSGATVTQTAPGLATVAGLKGDTGATGAAGADAHGAVFVRSREGSGVTDHIGAGGGVPGGWDTGGFDHSPWAATVASTYPSYLGTIPLSTWVSWLAGTGAPPGDEWLLWHEFTLPDLVPLSAVLTARFDNYGDAIEVNGVSVGTQTADPLGTLYTFLVDPSTLVPGGANSIAMHMRNDAPTSGNATAVDYQLEVEYATAPSGADGAAGAAGATGAAGSDGGIGLIGLPGPAGPAGADGADGAAGPTGATGATGAAGTSGGVLGVTRYSLPTGISFYGTSVDLLSFTPPAGTYVVWGCILIQNGAAAGNCVLRLFDGTVTQSGADISILFAGSSEQATMPPCILTTDGTVTYTLQATQNTSGATALVAGLVNAVPHVSEMIALQIA